MFLVTDGMIKSPQAADRFPLRAEMLEIGTKTSLTSIPNLALHDLDLNFKVQSI